MRRFILVFSLYSLFFTPLWAQSNLTYELKVGTTGEVTLLAEFPEVYEAEKLNIRIQTVALTEYRPSFGLTDSLDFVFANRPVDGIAAWGDSIYSYTDEAEVNWTVWKNHKEIKNRAQRVLVTNAYKAFEDYVVANTATAKRSRGWI